jgi:membrane-associated phospholipid phosphatase
MRALVHPIVLLALVTLAPTRAGAIPDAPASQAASAPASPPAPAVAPAALAAPAPRPSPSGDRLRVDWRVDVPVTGALGLGALAFSLTESKLGPRTCRWCEPDLNALDAAGRKARWSSHRNAADQLASVTAYGLTPVVAMGLVTLDAFRAGGWRQAAADDLVILEAAVLQAVMVSTLKYSLARKRPYVRDAAAGTRLGGGDNLSFPSGHTSLAFGIATASGTVATLRGYRSAPYVWGAGMTLATFTAYLRLAADKHYASDALVGAAIGALVGWAVPYLHYKLRKRR